MDRNMAKRARLLKHFKSLPTDRWLTAAEICDMLRSQGVQAHVRSVQSLLSSAAVRQEGLVGRYIGSTPRREYKFYDATQFIAYHQ
jgi:hypothetical protein